MFWDHFAEPCPSAACWTKIDSISQCDFCKLPIRGNESTVPDCMNLQFPGKAARSLQYGNSSFLLHSGTVLLTSAFNRARVLLMGGAWFGAIKPLLGSHVYGRLSFFAASLRCGDPTNPVSSPLRGTGPPTLPQKCEIASQANGHLVLMGELILRLDKTSGGLWGATYNWEVGFGGFETSVFGVITSR